MALLHAQEATQRPTKTPPGPAEVSSTGAAGIVPEDIDITASTLWASGRYRLTPSDVLELRFPYVPEFDQTVTVQPDGYISLRGLGDLRVQGRSLPELKLTLIEAYQTILKDPVINMILKEFEKPSFFASGEVEHPGKYELRGATTLTQALACRRRSDKCREALTSASVPTLLSRVAGSEANRREEDVHQS